MTTRIDLSDITDFAADLDGLDVKIEITIAMQKALDVLENNIVQRTPVNTGTLRAGTAKETQSIGLRLRGMVVNPVMYALPVETGRKAGKWPPDGPIRQYLIRKEGLSGRALDSAVFIMRRAIGKRGTLGAFMFDDGFKASIPTIVRIFNDVPAAIWNRVNR